jgi:non-lysosomal glucosylceramidase
MSKPQLGRQKSPDTQPTSPTACSTKACACSTRASKAAVDRRQFLKLLGAAAATATTEPWKHALAGPFTRKDFDRLVPEDKRLSPEWVKSLTERGDRSRCRGTDLRKIGMPIGGICSGQVYLGGDGRLWHWDIFNERTATDAAHYASPLTPASPLEQGFALRLKREGTQKPLDGEHWPDVSFIGEYPIGFVEYRDPDFPVAVSLEAYSPFIPLATEDSSLPATLLEFTVKNTSQAELELELGGWLENAVCLHSAHRRSGFHTNRVRRKKGLLLLECSAEDLPPGPSSDRPDIPFEDFEGETYGKWQTTGSAFGTGPVLADRMPAYQGEVRAHGKRLVNSHASAPGNSVDERDAATGTLTSPEFTISRYYINFLVGGGNHEGSTCINLLVDGEKVRSTTGAADNRLQPMCWDVRQWAGRKGQLQIVDMATGPWGNIGVDDIVFSDHPDSPHVGLANERDFGTLALALLEPRSGDFAVADAKAENLPAGAFVGSGLAAKSVRKPFGQKLVGSVTRGFKLPPAGEAKIRFLLSWCLPNLELDRLPHGRFYATRFASATETAQYVARNYTELSRATHLWHQTWYDSTLPYWFLDRTFLNSSILASSTCYRLGNGRFYGWEGVGCCEGTCGHVWQYAHAVARLFPDLERSTRENVDFGLALQPNGAIHFRGEFNDIPAIDAQAGTILRALREHQMSSNDQWLRRNWPTIKKATEWLIAKDGDGDGLITSNQHNTLDTDWYGAVAWLSGLYLAALAAAAEMADLVNDRHFASNCRNLLQIGRENIVSQLFDDGYFVNHVDPKHLDAINSGTGCHIDQVFGQSWAFQVGLPRVLPETETRSALKSLWRYNFTPDVGPYRQQYKSGRWYAMPGEAGLLMCTFPRSDWDYDQAKGKGPDWAAGYFNECMNGFEYQVAGHMLWEGLVTEGLAVARAVHDRYHPSRRNPFNEVECGDHYARSMASYGVFLAACGFEYDGPKGHIGFAPRLSPDNFKAAFTSAEGWGTFWQKQQPGTLEAGIVLRWGTIKLNSIALTSPGTKAQRVRVSVDGEPAPVRVELQGERVNIEFEKPVQLRAGQNINVKIG